MSAFPARAIAEGRAKAEEAPVGETARSGDALELPQRRLLGRLVPRAGHGVHTREGARERLTKLLGDPHVRLTELEHEAHVLFGDRVVNPEGPRGSEHTEAPDRGDAGVMRHARVHGDDRSMKIRAVLRRRAR